MNRKDFERILQLAASVIVFHHERVGVGCVNTLVLYDNGETSVDEYAERFRKQPYTLQSDKEVESWFRLYNEWKTEVDKSRKRLRFTEVKANNRKPTVR